MLRLLTRLARRRDEHSPMKSIPPRTNAGVQKDSLFDTPNNQSRADDYSSKSRSGSDWLLSFASGSSGCAGRLRSGSFLLGRRVLHNCSGRAWKSAALNSFTKRDYDKFEQEEIIVEKSQDIDRLGKRDLSAPGVIIPKTAGQVLFPTCHCNDLTAFLRFRSSREDRYPTVSDRQKIAPATGGHSSGRRF